MRSALNLLLTVSLFGTPLNAQEGPVVPLTVSAPSPAFRPPTNWQEDTRSRSNGGQSYWAEGGDIGAAALGILGIVVAAGLCSDGESNNSCFGPAVEGAILGAGVGFTVGALVGARFPKH